MNFGLAVWEGPVDHGVVSGAGGIWTPCCHRQETEMNGSAQLAFSF